MDEQVKEELKDFIFHAVQATKQENSGLIGEMRTNVAVLQTHYKDIMRSLEEIRIQTTKTNGSVTNLRLWRSLQVGSLIIITTIVIPLLVYIFNNRVEQVEARFNQIQK